MMGMGVINSSFHQGSYPDSESGSYSHSVSRAALPTSSSVITVDPVEQDRDGPIYRYVQDIGWVAEVIPT